MWIVELAIARLGPGYGGADETTFIEKVKFLCFYELDNFIYVFRIEMDTCVLRGAHIGILFCKWSILHEGGYCVVDLKLQKFMDKDSNPGESSLPVPPPPSLNPLQNSPMRGQRIVAPDAHRHLPLHASS